tara:strand:- start:273 stop:524 length:252 start_codon:yes stop_codon:yes gene_type:complete
MNHRVPISSDYNNNPYIGYLQYATSTIIEYKSPILRASYKIFKPCVYVKNTTTQTNVNKAHVATQTSLDLLLDENFFSFRING